jgi:hypothetical protein
VREPAKIRDLYKHSSGAGSSSHYLPEVLSTFRASMPSIEEQAVDATMTAEVQQNVRADGNAFENLQRDSEADQTRLQSARGNI